MEEKIVVGYVRVSGAQQEASVARQIDLIKEFCAKASLPPPLIISDQAISGYKDSRPGYQKLIAMVKTAKVSTVVVADLSRLSRSARSTIAFFQDLVFKYKIRFVALNQAVDSASPQGWAALQLTGIFAELYRNELSHKAKASAQYRKERGLRGGGTLPFAKRLAPDGRTLLTDEAELQTLLLIHRLRAGGLGYRAIARHLTQVAKVPTKTRLATWSPKVVRDLLKGSPPLSEESPGVTLDRGGGQDS